LPGRAPVDPSDDDDLVLTHLPLVGSLVRQLAQRIPSSVDRDDLRSAGMLALVSASRTFEAERGVPFAAYAATRIRGALLDELRAADWASRSVRRREREIAKARERLATTSPDRPDDMAVATELGVPLAVVRATDADAERARVASLHSLEGDGVDLPAPGWRCPEDVVLSAERLTYVAAAVAELPERLRIVVDGHYPRGRTFEEIAADLGITRARVYQLRADAVLLMRDALDRAYGSESECRPEPSGVAASRRTAYADAVHGRYLAASGRA